MAETKIYLILDNVRSCYNVGSLLRTAEGLGIAEVALCGITPYPELKKDTRPPYLAQKISARIHKTALGAEANQKWSYFKQTGQAIEAYRLKGATPIALEQREDAKVLTSLKIKGDIAMVVGSETAGISDEIIAQCEKTVSLAMEGQKESFNVAAAGAMALFYLKNVARRI